MTTNGTTTAVTKRERKPCDNPTVLQLRHRANRLVQLTKLLDGEELGDAAYLVETLYGLYVEGVGKGE